MFWGTKNCQFSVYFRWILGSRILVATGIRECAAKAVKAPLAVPKVAAGSLGSAFGAVRFEWLWHSETLGVGWSAAFSPVS